MNRSVPAQGVAGALEDLGQVIHSVAHIFCGHVRQATSEQAVIRQRLPGFIWPRWVDERPEFNFTRMKSLMLK